MSSIVNNNMAENLSIKYWLRPNKRDNFVEGNSNLWDTKNTDQFKNGDKIVFYISGVKKLAGIATFKGDNRIEFDFPLSELNWVDLPSEDFLRDLDFVKSKDYDFSEKYWLGLIVQSTNEISKGDYERLKNYIVESSK